MRKIIDGKAFADKIAVGLISEVSAFTNETGIIPTLAVILVGEDPASQVYVRRKVSQAERVGIRSIQHVLPAHTSEQHLLELVASMNADVSVHGILVQLPLPTHIHSGKILDAIRHDKDVDGFHPLNIGRLSAGTGGLIPCTPLGCMMLLESVVPDLRGKNAVVIGKSNIVGKPAALLLLERECTVTVTHILTQNLPDIVRQADIVLVAAGSPGLVRGDWVRPGAVVIDVGINRVVDNTGRSKIVGDVAFEEMEHVSAITPVPGGVGPMTIACLLSNTMRAAKLQNSAVSQHS